MRQKEAEGWVPLLTDIQYIPKPVQGSRYWLLHSKKSNQYHIPNIKIKIFVIYLNGESSSDLKSSVIRM